MFNTRSYLFIYGLLKDDARGEDHTAPIYPLQTHMSFCSENWQTCLSRTKHLSAVNNVRQEIL